MKPFALLLICCVLFACNKEKKVDPQKSTLTITMENVWNQQTIHLNAQKYINASEDTFTISRFRYYLSNIKLKGPNTNFIQAQSYFLIDEDNPNSLTINIPDIPEGQYNQISFGLGLDSTTNHSGLQTGVLSSAYNMVCVGSVGYVFWKLEGSYRSPSESGALTFHVGNDWNYKIVDKSLPTQINATTGSNHHIKIKCHADEFFKNPTTIKFSEINDVMTGSWTDTLANNTIDAFEILN